MTRDEAKRRFDDFLDECEDNGVTPNSEDNEAIEMVFTDMETVELLGKVLDRRISPYQKSDPYKDGADYAYENVREWLTDPDALRAEAQRLGVEE